MCAHLLIVEDDETVSEFLIDNLRADGHAVTTAACASEAVAATLRVLAPLSTISMTTPDKRPCAIRCATVDACSAWWAGASCCSPNIST